FCTVMLFFIMIVCKFPPPRAQTSSTAACRSRADFLKIILSIVFFEEVFISVRVIMDMASIASTITERIRYSSVI
ncbi:MAG: hypothetical protein QXX68_03325, partial [Candidatus Pacearchaeota archaeon]